MNNFIWILGRYSALVGTFLILLQLLLICWGKKTDIHKVNGKVALTLILIHGISMFYVYGFSVLKMEDVFKALIALLLLILVVFTSVVIRNKLKYETWYFVHLLTYFAILLAFGHQLELGTDFDSNIRVVLWYLMYLFVFINIVYFKLIKIILIFLKHKFFVEKVVRETKTTVSVYIGGKDIEKFRFEPGQYVVVRFLDKNLWWQAHPFSFSSMPGNKFLRLTIKNSGDFTSEINKIKIGTKMVLDGPHGEFIADQSKSNKILLLAGGVGVTPLRGLMEQFSNLKKDVVMVYANKNKDSVIFEKELSGYKVKHVFSDNGKRLDKDLLLELVPDIKRREAYICGPEIFNKSMKRYLQEFGVQYLHLEEFSL